MLYLCFFCVTFADCILLYLLYSLLHHVLLQAAMITQSIIQLQANLVAAAAPRNAVNAHSSFSSSSSSSSAAVTSTTAINIPPPALTASLLIDTTESEGEWEQLDSFFYLNNDLAQSAAQLLTSDEPYFPAGAGGTLP